MHEFLPFDVRLCRMMRKYFGNKSIRCVGDPVFTSPFAQLTQLLDNILPLAGCPLTYYPYAFWFLLAVSLCGAIFSLSELLNLCCCCSSRKLTIWRERQFYVLSCRMRKRFRKASAAVMMTAWILFIYGLLAVRPAAMFPYLFITTMTVGSDLCLWAIDVLRGRARLAFGTFWAFLKPISVLLLASSVKRTLDNAIKMQACDSFMYI